MVLTATRTKSTGLLVHSRLSSCDFFILIFKLFSLCPKQKCPLNTMSLIVDIYSPFNYIAARILRFAGNMEILIFFLFESVSKITFLYLLFAVFVLLCFCIGLSNKSRFCIWDNAGLFFKHYIFVVYTFQLYLLTALVLCIIFSSSKFYFLFSVSSQCEKNKWKQIFMQVWGLETPESRMRRETWATCCIFMNVLSQCYWIWWHNLHFWNDILDIYKEKISVNLCNQYTETLELTNEFSSFFLLLSLSSWLHCCWNKNIRFTKDPYFLFLLKRSIYE